MTDSTIFDTGAQTNVPPADNANNGVSEYLTQLVGDDKKFKSVEDLAKGKLEADDFIKKLQDENKQLREGIVDSSVKKQLDEFLTKIEQKSQTNSKEQTNPALSNTDIANLVREQLTIAETQRTAEQNIQAAHARMVELYGDKAKDILDAKARELGLSKEYLKEVSAKSPHAFLKIIGDTGSKEVVNTGKGSINTESSFNQDTKHGSSDYYKNLLKTDKKTYFSAKVQDEIRTLVAQGKLQLNY